MEANNNDLSLKENNLTWINKRDMHSDLDLQPNTSKGDKGFTRDTWWGQKCVIPEKQLKDIPCYLHLVVLGTFGYNL